VRRAERAAATSQVDGDKGRYLDEGFQRLQYADNIALFGHFTNIVPLERTKMIAHIRIVVALLSLVVLNLDNRAHAQSSSPNQAQTTSLIGTWQASIPMRKKGSMFTGELVVSAATAPNKYQGRLTLRYPGGEKSVVQDAIISVDRNKVKIKCSVVEQIGFGRGESYNADDFDLTLSGRVMSGGSQDASGYADENNVFKKM
jgi:hypothetical protein